MLANTHPVLRGLISPRTVVVVSSRKLTSLHVFVSTEDVQRLTCKYAQLSPLPIINYKLVTLINNLFELSPD